MTLTRDVAGLIFRDQFNRANDANVGNGWTEDALWSLESNRAKATFSSTGNGVLQRALTIGAVDFIVQNNFWIDAGDGQTAVRVGFNTNSAWLNLVPKPSFSPSWRLNMSGETNPIGSFDEGIPTNQWNAARVVHIAGSKTAKVLRIFNIASQDDLTQDFTEIISTTYTQAVPTFDGAYLFESLDSGSSKEGRRDEFFICGRNIVVTGLPAGWKVQVDGRAAVVESGGTVELDVDTWALPATTIKILDGSDVEQETLTPSGGIWGGDEYSTTAVGGNSPPDTPTLTVDGLRGTEADLSSSAFSDPEGDAHAASQWQVDVAGGDFSTPVFDSGRDVTNLLSITATGLIEETNYIARVRYEDDGSGTFGSYSAEVAFTTTDGEIWSDCVDPPATSWSECVESVGAGLECTGGELESSIVATSPAIYWRLNDLEGVSIVDDSGNERDGAMHVDEDTEGFTGTDFGVDGLPDGSGRAVQFNGGSFIQYPDDGVLDGRSSAGDDWRIGIMMFVKILSLENDIVLASMSESNQPGNLRAQWAFVIKSDGSLLAAIRKSNDIVIQTQKTMINGGADPFEVGKRYLVGMHADLNRVSIGIRAVDQAIEDDAGCNIESSGVSSVDNANFQPPYFFLVASRFFELGISENIIIDEVTVYNKLEASELQTHICTAWNNKDEEEICTVGTQWSACEESPATAWSSC